MELEDCDSEPNDSDVNQGNNDEYSDARADADWIGMDRGLLDSDNSHEVIEMQIDRASELNELDVIRELEETQGEWIDEFERQSLN